MLAVRVSPFIMPQRTIVLACVYFGVVAPAWAQQKPVPAPPPPKAITAGSALYREGELLLRRGRKFERAAGLFAQAAEKEPKNPAHQLAMGCAYTNRVASLAHAAVFTRMKAIELREYQSDLLEWQEAQKVSSSELYGKARPKPPLNRSYQIKDDGIPYRLTLEQLTARLSELCGKAKAAFDRGVLLAKTPEEQAETEYVRGWGMLILRQYVGYAGGEWDTAGLRLTPKFPVPFKDDGTLVNPEEKYLDIKNVPPHKDVDAAFEKATDLSPGTAIYWESRAEAESIVHTHMEYVRKALEIAPKNVPLWYRLFEWEMHWDKESPEFEVHRKIALQCLDNAARYDSANAYPRYLRAHLLYEDSGINEAMLGTTGLTLESKDAAKVPAAFKEAKTRSIFQNALRMVEAGNALPRFETPRYYPPVPRLLLPGWRYENGANRRGLNSAQLRELSRRLSVHAYLAAQEQTNSAEAISAARAVKGVGEKLMSVTPIRPYELGDSTLLTVLTGKAITAISYSLLINLYATWGNHDAANAAQADYAVFQKRSTKYTSDLAKSLEGDDDY